MGHWRTISGETAGVPDIWVGQLGHAEPRVAVTAWLHGDEDSGLLVLRELLAGHETWWRVEGSLTVIPCANPASVAEARRSSSIDGQDANRVGAGREGGTATERLVARIVRELAGSSLVINLHAFETISEPACVFIQPTDPQVRRRTLRAIAAFQPSYVLCEPAHKANASLDAALCAAGVPTYSVEFGRSDTLDAKATVEGARALVRVLVTLGAARWLGTTSPTQPWRPRAFERVLVRSTGLGYWKAPSKRLLTGVTASEVVGALEVLPQFESIDMAAPVEGTLLQVRPTELVRAGAILFAVGTPLPGVAVAV